LAAASRIGEVEEEDDVDTMQAPTDGDEEEEEEEAPPFEDDLQNGLDAPVGDDIALGLAVQEEKDEDSVDVPVLEQERANLKKWLRRGASLEEVRYLEYIKDWLSNTARTDVVQRMEALQIGDLWNNCAQEGEICQCLSGVMRYGSPDHGAWQNLDKSKAGKGEVQVKCNAEGFGGDPKKGTSKLCQCKSAECPDGSLADIRRCLEGERMCPSACGRDWRPKQSSAPKTGQLCKGGPSHELIFSCDRAKSIMPAKTHRHHEMQEVLDASMEELCKNANLKSQMETYLDCNFVKQFQTYVEHESGWFDEAYVSYVGGPKDSKHEHRATNLIRSVQAFSKLPLVLFVVDDVFEAPVFWRDFPCLIVFKMNPLLTWTPFNINKIRTMMTMRAVTGAELDGDQILYAGMDAIFEPTRREVTPEYPFPIMPVHWGAQEVTFDYYTGPRSMRWCHAHPTWTYWSLPFYGDLFCLRVTGIVNPGKEIRLWKLTAKKGTAADISMKELLRLGDAGKYTQEARVEIWMTSDEPMLNVLLWKAGATKAWCKFDLEPIMFFTNMKVDTHADPKWYPDGLPLIFWSLHNTKQDKETDLLLTLLIACRQPEVKARLQCKDYGGKEDPFCKYPKIDMLERRSLRVTSPTDYMAKMCCCVEPRAEKSFFWVGKWYKTSAEVPLVAGKHNSSRTCLLP